MTMTRPDSTQSRTAWIKALVAVARQAADAEALDHERAVMRLEVVENAGVDAGDELEHEHAGVEPVIKAAARR